MKMTEELNECLQKIFHAATERPLESGDFKRACELLGIARISYDMDLGEESRYRDPRTQ